MARAELRAAEAARSSSARVERAPSRKLAPAAVTDAPRLLRSSNRTPRMPSSCCIWALSTCWVMCTRRAAAVKLPSSATATK